MIFYGINYISITKRIAKANFNKRSLANLVQYQYAKLPKIKLSDNTKSKIKSILNNWLPTEKEYIKRNAANKAWSAIPPQNGRNCVHAHVSGKPNQQNTLRLLTLTITQEIADQYTDKEIKRKYLNNFLNFVTRHGTTHYFWISETQKNGNIHFHLIVNNYQSKYLDKWKSITNNQNKNAAHDRPINGNISTLANYLVKDDNTRIIDGNRYGMSKTVKAFENIKLSNVTEQDKFLKLHTKDLQLCIEFEYYYQARPNKRLNQKIKNQFMKIRKNQDKPKIKIGKPKST